MGCGASKEPVVAVKPKDEVDTCDAKHVEGQAGKQRISFESKTVVDADEAAAAAAQKPLPPPPLGARAVSLSWLQDFIAEHEIGKDMSTADVVRRHVVPATEAAGRTSYAAMELARGRSVTMIGPVTAFVSHAWNTSFVDLVEALEAHVEEVTTREGQDVANAQRFWLDIFAIQQHKGSVQADELASLGDVLTAARTTLCIMHPWARPVLVTRVWCLFEIMQTLRCSRGIVVTMSKAQREDFTRSLVERFDEIELLLSRLDVRKAEATVPEDKDMIHKQIQGSVGFEEMNKMVQVKLREWLCNAGLEVLESWRGERGDDDEEVRALMARMIELLRLANRLRMARSLAKEEVALWEASSDAAAKARAAQRLGMVFRTSGKLDKALPLLKAAHEGMVESLGGDHEDTLRCANDLAFTLNKTGQPQQAIAVYEEAMGVAEATYGDRHRHWMSLASNLAACLAAQPGRAEEAAALFQRMLATKEAEYGARHPSTFMSRTALGRAWLLQGDADSASRALAMLRECLVLCLEVLGTDHRHTFATTNDVGAALQSLGRYDEAMVQYDASLQGYLKTAGPASPSVMAVAANWAGCALQAGDGGKCVGLIQEWLNGGDAQKLLGDAAAGEVPSEGDRPALVSYVDGVQGALRSKLSANLAIHPVKLE